MAAAALPSFILPVPKHGPGATPKLLLAKDLALISKHLKLLSDRLSGIP